MHPINVDAKIVIQEHDVKKNLEIILEIKSLWNKHTESVSKSHHI